MGKSHTLYGTPYPNVSGTLYEMSRKAPGRRPRFSPAQIADVAFGIADREGFEAVSMRRVAHELGAGTMTLYHYVRTKDELVSLMDDRLMGQLLVPAEDLAGPWRDALSAILRRHYRMRLHHPWSLSALQSAAFGRNALRHAEQTLDALEDSPFSEEQKARVMAITDSFVDGHALRTVELIARLSAGATDPASSPIQEELAGGFYPHLGRRLAAEGWREQPAAWMDDLFEQGVAALLDGLARRFTGQ